MVSYVWLLFVGLGVTLVVRSVVLSVVTLVLCLACVLLGAVGLRLALR